MSGKKPPRPRGRPRTLAEGTERREVLLEPEHLAKAARLIEAGHGPTLSDAIRWAIERAPDR